MCDPRAVPDNPPPEPTDWVVWNGSLGLLATAALGRVAAGAHGRTAWLASPFDMVGPFSLDTLLHDGRIHFEACTVMSRQRWQADQVGLRQEALARRRAAQARQQQAHARRQQQHHAHGRWQSTGPHQADDERQHRQALNLPADGPLDRARIQAAFRRQAQRAHPDRGGSHEQFLRVAQARDALLGSAG